MNRRVSPIALVLFVCIALAPSALAGQSGSLRGSREKMLRQYGVADSSDYPLLQTATDVKEYAELGVLVGVEPSTDLQLSRVSFAVTRPEVRTFLLRLARRYYRACRRPLVVTSLTRPLDEQPGNASDLSVHPAGMAVDLRRPGGRGCRRWLERTLVAYQKQGVLDATRERHPAHYHVAVYPWRYMALLDGRGGVGGDAGSARPAAVSALAANATATIATSVDATATGHRRLVSVKLRDAGVTYRVQRGDTLGRIAARHGISVTLLKRVNGIRGSTIAPGQVLRIPPAE